MTFVIGVDGGGAHTSACLINSNLEILGQGASGASNIHSAGVEAACRNILEAIKQAARAARVKLPAAGVFCALSGAGRREDQETIRGALSSKSLTEKLTIGHDGESALAAAGLEHGLALLAGSGSFVWGRGADGREARADGWGSLLGDEAGGFAIGLAGLRAACRMHDRRGAETMLLQDALEFFAVEHPQQLIALVGKATIDRAAISRFAERVFAAANALDAVAVEIVESAVSSLQHSAAAVRAALYAPDAAVDLAAGGILLRQVELYRERFTDLWHKRFPADRLHFPQHDLSFGAAVLALRRAGIPYENAGAPPAPQAPASGQVRIDPRELEIFAECETLATEQRLEAAVELDQLPTVEILRIINAEDHNVAPAVAAVLPQVEQAVERLVAVFENGGRLFYLGAGSSGRLGCLDAAECSPTYGTRPELVQGVIAGGYAALLRSREGAEDDADAAIADLRRRAFDQRDMLVGLAASRRTPYVLSGLQFAHELGAATALITCSPPEKKPDFIDVLIAPATGPETVMGSTRMKAGTAQKMILNLLTTTAMIRLGKVYQGMMVDLRMSSDKLAQRALRTLITLTGLEYPAALDLLNRAGGHVKTALVMHETRSNAQQAQQALEKSRGFVRRAIQSL